jgi:putative heme-binding domain-containing protein
MRIAIVCVLLALSSTALAAEPFELRDGDRVVLVGNTFIEREQNYGHLETRFIARWPDRNVAFRNLGWSGDTVWCDSRGYEHDAARGFENLTKQIREIRPTVVFVGYGMVESFDGDAGLPRFRRGLERMLDMLAAEAKPREVVLISPIRHEKLAPPLPDPTSHNVSLRKCADAIADVATKRNLRFVSLFDAEVQTDNGIHPTEAGYRVVADTITNALSVEVAASQTSENVRQLAIRKNVQFFNQWRPANEPYLFGFRKQEQSRNQIELPRFAQTIDQLEDAMRKAARREHVDAPSATRPSATTSPSDPEIERKSFKVAEGFEVNLFASDPQIAKPIQMNFDARGRMWVASSAQYPQIKPGEQPADRIVVLEDADGDGRAEKSTTFADELLIPTGVQPDPDGRGAYVANSHEIVYLRDTDGDGHADSRRVVLSGFGTEDTHHVVHTFHSMNDGRLYFNQSIYIHSHIETPRGVRRLAGSGTWRFDPRTMQLDVFSRGMCNPWGHAQDDWGQSFGTDGAGGEGLAFVWPGSVYPTAVGFDRVLHGMNPGSPKYCGLDIVGGSHLPDDWQNSAITNDFRGNRVVRFQLREADGQFVSKQMPDVITSSDVNFRPVDVRQGPDGAIYIADWYNPIINHGEVDFRDPRRDKTHGRIWRLTAKGRPLAQKPKLVGEPVEKLLEQLKSAEPWTRRQAKLVLTSLGAEKVTPVLEKWLGGVESEHDRLEALWTYQSLNTPRPKLLRELLESTTPQARAAATRVIGDWLDALPDALDLLAARVADDASRVRLEAVRTLARFPQPRAIEIAMRALDRPRDKDLDYALWLTARDTADTWVPAVEAGKLNFDDDPAHATFALRAARSPQAAALLARMYHDGRVPAAERDETLDVIGEAGVSNAEAGVLLDVATSADAPIALRVRALSAMEKAARRGVLASVTDADRLTPLLTARDEKLRTAAVRVAGVWKHVPARPALTAAVESADTRSAVRQAAIAALVDLGGESADFFRKLDSTDHPFEVRVATLVGLFALDRKDAANRAAALLAKADDKTDPTALLAGFLKRDGGGDALAAALSGKRLNPAVAIAALKHIESTGRDEPALATFLRNATGHSSVASKKLSRDEMARLVASVAHDGDAARGVMIFRRADTGCFKCHAIQGAGGQLGPDLGTIGAASPVDYLIDSLLDPNKAIKDGYNSVVVKVKGGDVHNGIKVSQDDTQMILRDALTDRIAIPIGQIKEEKPGGSLMPTGLIDNLPAWEQTNLFRFLSELGKPGAFGPGDPRVVRRWRVLPADAAAKLAADPTPIQSHAGDKLPWTPVYSLVNGDLPADAMATAGQPVAFVRCELDVTAAGRVTLHVGETRGLAMWVDDQAVDAKSDVEVDRPPGVHAVTFKVDVGERGQGLRLEVRADAAHPVTGR